MDAQLGVGFYQASLPFVEINYELADRWRPALRLGVDRFLEDVPVSVQLTYDIVEREAYEVYAGAGLQVALSPSETTAALIVPLGLNAYPFADRRLGFHIELLPYFEENAVLFGAWGVRWRFGGPTGD